MSCDKFVSKTKAGEIKGMAIAPFSGPDKNLPDTSPDSRQDVLLQAFAVIDTSEIREINAQVQAKLHIEASLREIYRRQQQQQAAHRAQALNQLILNSSPEDIFELIQAICSEE